MLYKIKSMTELIETILEIKFKRDDIRIFGTYDDPLFVVNEIYKILGIVRTNITDYLKNIPDKWKSKRMIQTTTGLKETHLVNEAGLYWIVIRSNKPEAIPFREWICEEVLPSIRKTGKYKLDEERMKLLNELKQETEYRIQFQKLYTRAMEQNEELHEANKRQVKMNTELQHDLIYAKNPERDEPDPADREEERAVLRQFKKMQKMRN